MKIFTNNKIDFIFVVSSFFSQNGKQRRKRQQKLQRGKKWQLSGKAKKNIYHHLLMRKFIVLLRAVDSFFVKWMETFLDSGGIKERESDSERGWKLFSIGRNWRFRSWNISVVDVVMIETFRWIALKELDDHETFNSMHRQQRSISDWQMLLVSLWCLFSKQWNEISRTYFEQSTMHPSIPNPNLHPSPTPALVHLEFSLTFQKISMAQRFQQKMERNQPWWWHNTKCLFI